MSKISAAFKKKPQRVQTAADDSHLEERKESPCSLPNNENPDKNDIIQWALDNNLEFPPEFRNANYRKTYKFTYTITFGDQGENHKGMQIIGQAAEKGYTTKELKQLAEDIPNSEYFNLTTMAKNVKNHDVKLPNAGILIIRNAVSFLTHYTADQMIAEQANIGYDEQAIMYGRMVNKNARHNVCFSDEAQVADIANKKGTIVAWRAVPLLSEMRDNLAVNFGPKAKNLIAEGNYYYDSGICGIGFHGDSERKIVLGLRLGETMPLVFQWYFNGDEISDIIEFELNNGDLYIMSEKAVGSDWKHKKIATLRHAAGCSRYTNLPKKANAKISPLREDISIQELCRWVEEQKILLQNRRAEIQESDEQILARLKKQRKQIMAHLKADFKKAKLKKEIDEVDEKSYYDLFHAQYMKRPVSIDRYREEMRKKLEQEQGRVTEEKLTEYIVHNENLPYWFFFLNYTQLLVQKNEALTKDEIKKLLNQYEVSEDFKYKFLEIRGFKTELFVNDLFKEFNPADFPNGPYKELLSRRFTIFYKKISSPDNSWENNQYLIKLILQDKLPFYLPNDIEEIPIEDIPKLKIQDKPIMEIVENILADYPFDISYNEETSYFLSTTVYDIILLFILGLTTVELPDIVYTDEYQVLKQKERLMGKLKQGYSKKKRDSEKDLTLLFLQNALHESSHDDKQLASYYRFIMLIINAVHKNDSNLIEKIIASYRSQISLDYIDNIEQLISQPKITASELLTFTSNFLARKTAFLKNPLVASLSRRKRRYDRLYKQFATEGQLDRIVKTLPKSLGLTPSEIRVLLLNRVKPWISVSQIDMWNFMIADKTGKSFEQMSAFEKVYFSNHPTYRLELQYKDNILYFYRPSTAYWLQCCKCDNARPSKDFYELLYRERVYNTVLKYDGDTEVLKLLNVNPDYKEKVCEWFKKNTTELEQELAMLQNSLITNPKLEKAIRAQGKAYLHSMLLLIQSSIAEDIRQYNSTQLEKAIYETMKEGSVYNYLFNVIFFSMFLDSSNDLLKYAKFFQGLVADSSPLYYPTILKQFPSFTKFPELLSLDKALQDACHIYIENKAQIETQKILVKMLGKTEKETVIGLNMLNAKAYVNSDILNLKDISLVNLCHNKDFADVEAKDLMYFTIDNNIECISKLELAKMANSRQYVYKGIEFPQAEVDAFLDYNNFAVGKLQEQQFLKHKIASFLDQYFRLVQDGAERKDEDQIIKVPERSYQDIKFANEFFIQQLVAEKNTEKLTQVENHYEKYRMLLSSCAEQSKGKKVCADMLKHYNEFVENIKKQHIAYDVPSKIDLELNLGGIDFVNEFAVQQLIAEKNQQDLLYKEDHYELYKQLISLYQDNKIDTRNLQAIGFFDVLREYIAISDIEQINIVLNQALYALRLKKIKTLFNKYIYSNPNLISSLKAADLIFQEPAALMMEQKQEEQEVFNDSLKQLENYFNNTPYKLSYMDKNLILSWLKDLVQFKPGVYRSVSDKCEICSIELDNFKPLYQSVEYKESKARIIHFCSSNCFEKYKSTYDPATQTAEEENIINLILTVTARYVDYQTLRNFIRERQDELGIHLDDNLGREIPEQVLWDELRIHPYFVPSEQELMHDKDKFEALKKLAVIFNIPLPKAVSERELKQIWRMLRSKPDFQKLLLQSVKSFDAFHYKPQPVRHLVISMNDQDIRNVKFKLNQRVNNDVIIGLLRRKLFLLKNENLNAEALANEMAIIETAFDQIRLRLLQEIVQEFPRIELQLPKEEYRFLQGVRNSLKAWFEEHKRFFKKRDKLTLTIPVLQKPVQFSTEKLLEALHLLCPTFLHEKSEKGLSKWTRKLLETKNVDTILFQFDFYPYILDYCPRLKMLQTKYDTVVQNKILIQRLISEALKNMETITLERIAREDNPIPNMDENIEYDQGKQYYQRAGSYIHEKIMDLLNKNKKLFIDQINLIEEIRRGANVGTRLQSMIETIERLKEAIFESIMHKYPLENETSLNKLISIDMNIFIRKLQNAQTEEEKHALAEEDVHALMEDVQEDVQEDEDNMEEEIQEQESGVKDYIEKEDIEKDIDADKQVLKDLQEYSKAVNEIRLERKDIEDANDEDDEEREVYEDEDEGQEM